MHRGRIAGDGWAVARWSRGRQSTGGHQRPRPPASLRHAGDGGRGYRGRPGHAGRRVRSVRVSGKLRFLGGFGRRVRGVSAGSAGLRRRPSRGPGHDLVVVVRHDSSPSGRRGIRPGISWRDLDEGSGWEHRLDDRARGRCPSFRRRPGSPVDRVRPGRGRDVPPPPPPPCLAAARKSWPRRPFGPMRRWRDARIVPCASERS